MKLDDVFSPRGWDDVQKKVSIRVHLSWRGATYTQIEDAVSEAMTSLVSYWSGTKGGVTEDHDRNFNFAVKYAERYANKVIAKELDRDDILLSPLAWERLSLRSSTDHIRYDSLSSQEADSE